MTLALHHSSRAALAVAQVRVARHGGGAGWGQEAKRRMREASGDRESACAKTALKSCGLKRWDSAAGGRAQIKRGRGQGRGLRKLLTRHVSRTARRRTP